MKKGNQFISFISVTNPIKSNVDVDITYKFTVEIVLQLSGKFEGSSLSQK